MSQTCYVCKKYLGTFSVKWSYNDYLYKRIPLPDGMSNVDHTCNLCLEQLKKALKEETIEAQKEIRADTQQLLTRTPEYKKKWNKNGIVQFKNERIAILQRAFGVQVEFIIAFDDLTAEGYELKAIDEGKTGNAQGMSGGVNSYFYFQKNESLSFPNSISNVSSTNNNSSSNVSSTNNNSSSNVSSTNNKSSSPF